MLSLAYIIFQYQFVLVFVGLLCCSMHVNDPWLHFSGKNSIFIHSSPNASKIKFDWHCVIRQGIRKKHAKNLRYLLWNLWALSRLVNLPKKAKIRPGRLERKTLHIFFFFCVPQLYLWGSPFFCVRFLCMWPFFNPTIKVVTFRLRGWCVLGVFLFPAFTRLGHECQDLLSSCDEMHVCTD